MEKNLSLLLHFIAFSIWYEYLWPPRKILGVIGGWKNFFHEVSPFKCILIFHTINSMALAILGYTTPWLTNIGNKHLVGQSIILVLESVQYFLIKLGIKPRIHTLKISIFSLNHVIVRHTKIIKNLCKSST